MKTKILISSFATIALLAEAPRSAPMKDEREWTLTFSQAIGYCNDRQKQRENLETVSLENLNSVQVNLNLVIAWERLFLKLWGDYSWLCSGHADLTGKATPFHSSDMHFPDLRIGSSYSADIAPAIGCRVKFWTFGDGSLSFIPLLAYKYAHFNASPMGQVQNSFTTVDYTRPIQQDWFGPLFEGRIGFAWQQQWHLDFFYQYQPLNFRQTQTQCISNFYFGGTVNSTLVRISSRGDTLRMQLGGADLSYRSPDHWQVGTHFEGSSIWSNTAKSLIHSTTQTLDESTTSSTYKEQLAVEWVRYLVNFYASYWF